MKLLKCYISSFGKLKNYTYDFTDGVNTILEENGFGKTTFANFIKCMFYGIDNGRKGIDESDRKKYKPWNSNDKFGGYVDFVWGDKSLKIERYFGNKEAEDTVRLFDLLTGKEFSNKEDLGKRIFGIDEEGFISTTYFIQKDYEIKSNDSITQKFNSLLDETETDSIKNAMGNLAEKAKTFKARGDKGLIADTSRKIYEVKEEIESCKNAEKTLILVKKEIENLTVSAENLEKEIEKLSSNLKKAGEANAVKIKKERYFKAKEELEGLKANLEIQEKILNGYYPEQVEIDKCSNFYEEFISISGKIKALTETIEELKKSISPKSSKKPLLPIAFGVISVIMLVLALSLIKVVSIGILISIFALFGLSTLVFGVLLALFFKNNKKNDGYIEIVLSREKELSVLSDKKNFLANEITSFISKFVLPDNLDVLSCLSLVKSAINDKIKLQSELKERENLLNYYSKDDDIFSKEETVYDYNLINNQLKTKNDEFKLVNNEIARKTASLNMIEVKASSLIDAESQLERLREDFKNYTEEYNIILKTIEYLERADQNLKSKYKKPLEDSFNNYLKKLGATFNKDASIDVDMKVLICEDKGARETEYYSKGLRNLFDICKRFALLSVLFDREKPFIILDDPFYNLDEEKIENAKELVKNLAEEYQIIYLSCHHSRAI